MSTLKKLAKATMILLAVITIFSSCSKDESVTPEPQAQNAEGNFLTLATNNGSATVNNSMEDCFAINYPIGVNIPGEGIVSVNSEEELWEEIMAFFETLDEEDFEDWNEDDFPTMVFPITVTTEDGTVLSVADDEQLCDLYHECYGDEEGEFDPDVEWEDPCFTFDYPISLSDGNGNIVTVNDESEWETVFENGGEYDYFEIVFPLNVILTDGTAQTIEDEEGIEALYEDCFGGQWEDPEDCDSTYIEELCFEFVYPINIELPDGSSVSVSDEENLFTTIYEFYEENPDSDEDPTLTYPIDVVLEDGTTATVNNEDELEEVFEECLGDGFGLVNQNVVVGMARMR